MAVHTHEAESWTSTTILWMLSAFVIVTAISVYMGMAQ
jgi:hypothetical protein